ncbi:hypothetical protein ACH5RR_023342 [Cinchona calisaya]|uniref:Uncharacterized protein n=1 Tax=Cinchona calisaya TaxID=153742 RepID=A0ABD2ZAD8_9GENT
MAKISQDDVNSGYIHTPLVQVNNSSFRSGVEFQANEVFEEVYKEEQERVNECHGVDLPTIVVTNTCIESASTQFWDKHLVASNIVADENMPPIEVFGRKNLLKELRWTGIIQGFWALFGSKNAKRMLNKENRGSWRILSPSNGALAFPRHKGVVVASTTTALGL